MKCLYNVIYATLYPKMKLNTDGYAHTSSDNIATNIWTLAHEWGSLINREATPIQAVFGMKVHRLKANKEVVQILHRTRHSVSCNKVLQNNNAMSKSQPKTHFLYRNLIYLHSTIDNIDILQGTKDGSGTIYATN